MSTTDTFEQDEVERTKLQLCQFFRDNVPDCDNADLMFFITHVTIILDLLRNRPKQIIRYLFKKRQTKKSSHQQIKFYQLRPMEDREIIRIVDQSSDINGFLMACVWGSKNNVKVIYESRCTVIYRCNSSGSNGLHLACEFSHPQVVNYLLKKYNKKLIYAKNGLGRTPFHSAAIRGNPVIFGLFVKYFKSYGILDKFMKMKDYYNKTPLESAIEFNSPEVVKIINSLK